MYSVESCRPAAIGFQLSSPLQATIPRGMCEIAITYPTKGMVRHVVIIIIRPLFFPRRLESAGVGVKPIFTCDEGQRMKQVCQVLEKILPSMS